MPMCAEVLAIGPFSRELVAHYDYAEQRYANTREGAPIVRTLFGLVEGTHASTAFAEALGLDDAWDFNQHKIDLTRIDFAAVAQLLSTLSTWTDSNDYQRDLAALRAFADAKYDLYYLPNG